MLIHLCPSHTNADYPLSHPITVDQPFICAPSTHHRRTIDAFVAEACL